MLSLASSSRLPAALSPSLMFMRTKKTNKASRFPKEPKPLSYRQRIQKPKSPHDIRTPRPYAGASEPRPLEYSPYIPNTTSVPLANSHLRLHHSPPATAPTYQTGQVPPLLQWLSGKSVILSGEEKAPLRKPINHTYSPNFVSSRDWSRELIGKIRALRNKGKSRTKILRALKLPSSQRAAISMVSQINTRIAAQRAADKGRNKAATYNMRKKLRDEVKRRRKEFW